MEISQAWPLDMKCTGEKHRLLVLVVALLLMTGCDQHTPETRFETYLQRLAYTLQLPVQDAAPAQLQRLPDKRQLHITLDNNSLDILDFMALSGCAVQITIGKLNSSLGRFASDSQRLLLTLEYLQLAPQCIEFMRSTAEDELADALQRAFLLKQQQLPAMIYNATLVNIEYRKLWRPPSQLDTYPAQTSSAVISALETINALANEWLGGNYAADNMAFEILLSEVAKGDGGALQMALALQHNNLGVANTLLQAHMTQGPLCSAQTRPAAARIVPNVVQKYFIDDIQPWSASLGRRYYELLPAITALEQLIAPTLPTAYLDWQIARDDQLGTWVKAPARHVQHIKKLLLPCEQ